MLRAFRLKSILKTAILVVATFASVSISVRAQTASSSPTPEPNKELHRWFDMTALSLATRYRYVDSANGQTVFNHQQFQVLARGRFKFDSKGKYSVGFGFETGNSETAGWNNTGWGTGDLMTNVYLKMLYFDAKPVKPIEVQVGGLGMNNGENTEITGYDNDAYMMGERVIVRSPKSLYFDEISLTNGYFGDTTTPNVFRRFRRMGKSNFHQFLVRKQATKRVGFSADYTFEAGIDRLRQAVKVKVPELKVVDSLLYENYEQLDPNAGYGFGLSGEKKVNKRVSLTGGVTKISHNMFNGDRFPRGERLYLSTLFKLSREFTINPVIIQAIGPLATPQTHKTRFELIFSYNILEAFHRYHVY